MSAICGCVEKWRKKLSHCWYCKQKTRQIESIVYSGYGSNIICGKCGGILIDLDTWQKGDKEEIKRRKQLVSDVWSGKIKSFKGTFREYFEAMTK